MICLMTLKKAIRAHYGIIDKDKRKAAKPQNDQIDRENTSIQIAV